MGFEDFCSVVHERDDILMKGLKMGFGPVWGGMVSIQPTNDVSVLGANGGDRTSIYLVATEVDEGADERKDHGESTIIFCF